MERPDRPVIGTFLVSPPLRPGDELALDAEVIHHLRVRRVERGSRMRLTDGAGRSATATLVELSKRSARATVERIEVTSKPGHLQLLVPIADRDRTLWLAEKAVELGLTQWTPVRWQRSRSVATRGEGDAFRAKVRARMVAALEQSGGSWLPTLDRELEPNALATALENERFSVRVQLDRVGEPILAALAPDAGAIVALGPEGGFEPHETDLLRRVGFLSVTLAASTLRFETAAVAALAVINVVRSAAGKGSATASSA